MKKNAPENFKFLSRLCLINCILAGLLFSCGEGIRLCPFPTTEGSTTNQTILNLESEIAYQFSAHRFEDQRGNSGSSFQTDGANHFWVNNGDSVRNFSLALTTKRNGDNFSVRKTLKLKLFFESGKSRAPPFTV